LFRLRLCESANEELLFVGDDFTNTDVKRAAAA
jgi:uncharacterized protein with PIN domain